MDSKDARIKELETLLASRSKGFAAVASVWQGRAMVAVTGNFKPKNLSAALLAEVIENATTVKAAVAEANKLAQ